MKNFMNVGSRLKRADCDAPITFTCYKFVSRKLIYYRLLFSSHNSNSKNFPRWIQTINTLCSMSRKVSHIQYLYIDCHWTGVSGHFL